jgi:hypothetical protein
MVSAVPAVVKLISFPAFLWEAVEQQKQERKQAVVSQVVVANPVVSSTIVQISQEARERLAAEQQTTLRWDWEM